jgi:hypothetical protein
MLPYVISWYVENCNNYYVVHFERPELVPFSKKYM